ncbi:MAG: enoyl-ACP reductase FabV [Pseudomonadales bacterium]|jgi:enoyl-[acyl-carrier protein] reductase/trans-2-enoyl-CoA reductase (NAD+)|nr:enoyl-ACP reductase FabV [Pseudomonadales bacterium]
MIVKPRVRGFICTTAHPVGCAAHVAEQVRYVSGRNPLGGGGPNRVLVLGCSAGYGLASRISAAFGGGAATLGVSFEKPPSETRTASAGWYNNRAFEAEAAKRGLWAKTLEGDAFSDELKDETLALIRDELGPLDLVIYSLASPVRTDPDTGITWRSTIKPMGEPVHIKTLNVDRAEVHQIDLEPATEEEVAGTVKVMGGEDWERWMQRLADAELLAPGCRTLAYTYIGSELTWPIYWHGTLGKAKEDLDRAARAIDAALSPDGGAARVAVLKAVVTQASAAIPVVPLYASLLYRVMKEQGVHEEVIAHVQRLFETQLYGDGTLRLDDAGRIRVDDLELSAPIQEEVKRRWPEVTTGNLDTLSDFAGFRADFLKIFGFGVEGVDYDADVDPLSIEPPAA